MTRVVTASLDGDGSSLLMRGESEGAGVERRASRLIRGASMVVGMHADAATEPIVDLALLLGVPCAVIPCCVLPALFPHRTIVVGKREKAGQPIRQTVRSYRAFTRYLLAKGYRPRPFGTDYLAFVGKNKVIFEPPLSELRVTVW